MLHIELTEKDWKTPFLGTSVCCRSYWCTLYLHLKKDVESTVKYIAEGLKKPGAQVKKGWRSRSGSSFTQKITMMEK